jgi:hypothetical protein
METGVHARGGGSASLMLNGFAKAETEWILGQLWNGSAPSISEQSFAKQLRSSIFYGGSPLDPDYVKDFSRSLELFRKAERSLKPEQRFVLRKEVLEYFSGRFSF